MTEKRIINGTEYYKGQKLYNYRDSASLSDAWAEIALEKRPFWYKNSDGDPFRITGISIFDFPITILEVPPEPKPEPVKDWLEHLKAGETIYYIDPLKDEVDSYQGGALSGLMYLYLTAYAQNGVQFYKTREDCCEAEGIKE